MTKKGYYGDWGGAFNPEILQQTFKQLNKAFEEATGYKREEIVGRNPFFLIHPEDRGLVYRRYVEREKGLRDIMETYSWRVIRKDGEVRWVTARPGRVTYRGKPAVAAGKRRTQPGD